MEIIHSKFTASCSLGLKVVIQVVLQEYGRSIFEGRGLGRARPGKCAIRRAGYREGATGAVRIGAVASASHEEVCDLFVESSYTYTEQRRSLCV